MGQVFQTLIEHSHMLLDLKTIKTILGYNHRPKYRKRKKAVEWEVAVEKPAYDLTICKLHCGKLPQVQRIDGTRGGTHNTMPVLYRDPFGQSTGSRRNGAGDCRSGDHRRGAPSWRCHHAWHSCISRA
jgi:hypothetical protein